MIVLIGRLLQGFSAGAELGGVSVYLAEMATPGHRGFYTAWQSASQQVAIVMAAALGFAVNRWLTADEITAWGWRIPFFVGCSIVPLIFILRRSLLETEEFLARRHHPDAREIFRTMLANWAVVLEGMLLVAMTTTTFYLITVYTPTFGKVVLKLTAADSLVDHPVRRIDELLLAAYRGRAVGSNRPAASFDRNHRPGDSYRLPAAVVGCCRTKLSEAAAGTAPVFVLLRDVQRRHGGDADGSHAGCRCGLSASRSPSVSLRRCSAA